MTPFRSEKNTNWEGAFRVPELIRWPGKIPAGVVSNEIIQHHDWLPTFLAAAGDPDIVEKLKAGHEVGDKTFKVHIDGYNLLPYLTGEVDEESAQGVLLLLRRRRRAGDALRQLEGRVHGAAGPGHAADLGGAVRRAARPEAVQPAHRSLRAGRHHLQHLLRLVARQRTTSCCAATHRGEPVPADVRGVPAARRRRRASRSTRRWRSSRPCSPRGDSWRTAWSGFPAGRSGWDRTTTTRRRRPPTTSPSMGSGSTEAR